MAEKRNDLRIPFAEWLYRMYEAELAPQARALAVYVAAFKIGNNDELSALSGIADKTYDKWKKELLKEGWVIISRRKGGRGIGIEVHPALRETPVTFTDLFQRNPDKFYPGIEDAETPVISTETVEETPVIIAPLVRADCTNNITNTTTYKNEEEEKEDAATPLAALEAFDLYNALAEKIGLPQARTLTPQRRKSLIARMREHGGIEAWKIALANVEKSAFLQGQNDRGWRADFDFLLQAARFTKVVEGTYGNGAHAGKSNQEPEETREQRYARILAAVDGEEKRS